MRIALTAREWTVMKMREILFRGKRMDNGEWETGSLVIIRGACSDKEVFIADKMTGYHTPVIPETVCQFTGLYDKNGMKIFEGDIVRTKKYGKVIGHTNVNDYDAFQVVYEPAIFRLVNSTRGFNLVGQAIDWEVIGNIYDNPELLGVRDEIL